MITMMTAVNNVHSVYYTRQHNVHNWSIVLQRYHVLHSCFEWSAQQKPVSARWSTSRVQLVRRCRLDIKRWMYCAHSLVIGILGFLSAVVSYTFAFSCHQLRFLVSLQFHTWIHIKPFTESDSWNSYFSVINVWMFFGRFKCLYLRYLYLWWLTYRWNVGFSCVLCWQSLSC